MKKIIAILLVSGTLFSSTATASPKEDNPEKVSKSFYQHFPAARDVRFETSFGLIVVTFSDNDKNCMAVFNQDGSMAGNGYYVNPKEVPFKINNLLRQKFGEFDTETALQYFPENDQSYYCAALLSGKKRILVKVYDSGYIEVYKKENRMLVANMQR